MSAQDVTPWFPADVKPVRPGVYQTRQPDGTCFYNEFDGKEWFCGNYDIIPSRSWEPLPPRLLAGWRGLAQDPNAQLAPEEQPEPAAPDAMLEAQK